MYTYLTRLISYLIYGCPEHSQLTQVKIYYNLSFIKYHQLSNDVPDHSTMSHFVKMNLAQAGLDQIGLIAKWSLGPSGARAQGTLISSGQGLNGGRSALAGAGLRPKGPCQPSLQVQFVI